jgi:molybdopterin converting factor subunit 1
VRIHLLYFASFREAVGREEDVLDMPAGSRVADLWRELTRRIPHFQHFERMPPAALNRQYVDAETALSEGDEVAFLPPVAGG